MKEFEVLSPLQVSAKYRGGSAGPDSHSVNALGYPSATNGKENNAQWYVQQAAEGLVYCVYTETRHLKGETIIAISITTNRDGGDPVALAKKHCVDALNTGIDKCYSEHQKWSKAFRSKSKINLPEKTNHDY